jgi:hypothetical protein
MESGLWPVAGLRLRAGGDRRTSHPSGLKSLLLALIQNLTWPMMGSLLTHWELGLASFLAHDPGKIYSIIAFERGYYEQPAVSLGRVSVRSAR